MADSETSDSLGRARQAIDEAERLQRVVAGIHDVTPSVLTLLTTAARELLEVVELHDLEREQ